MAPPRPELSLGFEDALVDAVEEALAAGARGGVTAADVLRLYAQRGGEAPAAALDGQLIALAAATGAELRGAGGTGGPGTHAGLAARA